MGAVTKVPLALGAGRIVSVLVPQFLTPFHWQTILTVVLPVVVMRCT